MGDGMMRRARWVGGVDSRFRGNDGMGDGNDGMGRERTGWGMECRREWPRPEW